MKTAEAPSWLFRTATDVLSALVTVSALNAPSLQVHGSEASFSVRPFASAIALWKCFVLMTGNLADADKAATELRGVPILPKPFTLAQLREMLNRVTSSPSS